MGGTRALELDQNQKVSGRHDHRLALTYYLAAIAVIGFYGTRVCPFIDGLDSLSVLATFAVGFGAALALKLAFEDRLMPDREPFTVSVYQFFIDLALFVAVGVGVALYNHWVRDFPLESGAKVLAGCIMFGIFAGLDNGLLRERRTPPELSRLTEPPKRIFPITRRLTVVFSGIAVFTGLVGALIVIKDIDFLIDNIGTEPHQDLRRMVFLDVGFVIVTVLVLSIRLMSAYGGNLRYMLSLQIGGLNRVAGGELETWVPIVTNDEFSLIASKTNHMIRTLQRANREQQELFEVSLALARELRLERLLERIVATTRSFVGAERVSLFLHDEARGELWAKVAEGVDAAELRFAQSRGLAGYVFTSGETLIIEDAHGDPRFNPSFDEATGYRTRDVLCVPIVDREGRTLGVIQALNCTDGTFDADDATRLRAFAAQAAVALHNARLFTDLERMRNYNESILRSLTNGVVTLDAEHRVVKANEAALAILELDEQPRGRPFEALFGGERSWLTPLMARSTEHLSGTQQENRLADVDIELANGHLRSVNLVAVPLADLEDQEIGSMIVLEDVTEEQRIRSTMSRYLPSQVAERVLADPDNKLGGTSQPATVLFADIRSFTSIAEAIGARETVAMLNEYFSAMCDAINGNDGIVDKYIGDAIMAVFGVPFGTERDADNAVRAAMGMMRQLEELNRRRCATGREPIAIGVGLSTGDVVAGNVGSARRMDYTVIGDTVNLAARLESLTTRYGASLLISGQTRDALRDAYPMRELDEIRVKGKGEPVRLYQVLVDDAISAASLAMFQEGREHYRRCRWRAAVACLEQVLAEVPDDAASRLLMERCDEYQASPPPEDWDGVWTATSKS